MKTKQLFEQITKKLASGEIYFQITDNDCFLVWEEETEEKEPNIYRITTITHQVKVGDLSLNTKFYLEKSLNKLEEYLQEKIPQEIRKMITARLPINKKETK